MGTNEIHPFVRKCQQNSKRFLRSCRNKMPHKNRKWWKAWRQTWNAIHSKNVIYCKIDDIEWGE